MQKQYLHCNKPITRQNWFSLSKFSPYCKQQCRECNPKKIMESSDSSGYDSHELLTLLMTWFSLGHRHSYNSHSIVDENKSLTLQAFYVGNYYRSATHIKAQVPEPWLQGDILNKAELTYHNPDKFCQQLLRLLHIDSVHKGWCNVTSWHSLGYLETKEVWVKNAQGAVFGN